jgi:hypothetical protein
MSSSSAVAEWSVDANGEPGVTEFDYHPVPPLVPVSAAFVLLSLTAFLWDVLLVVPVVGFLLALVAIWQVKISRGAYGGLKLATVSAVLIVVLAGTAVGFHTYNFATELPPGLQRVNFPRDIAAKPIGSKDGQPLVDPEVKQLDGAAVFLKGFMYPTRETRDLKSFVLCKDSGDCCFGGQPKPTDMILIEMKEGQTINYRAGLVAVGGDFRIHPTLDQTGLNPVYKLECGYFSAAKTAY